MNCVHKTIVGKMNFSNFFQTLKLKPFLCDVCSKEWTSIRNEGLELHNKAIHEDELKAGGSRLLDCGHL